MQQQWETDIWWAADSYSIDEYLLNNNQNNCAEPPPAACDVDSMVIDSDVHVLQAQPLVVSTLPLDEEEAEETRATKKRKRNPTEHRKEANATFSSPSSFTPSIVLNTVDLTYDSFNNSSLALSQRQQQTVSLDPQRLSADVSVVRYFQHVPSSPGQIETHVDGSLPDDPRLLTSVIACKENLVTLDYDVFRQYIQKVQRFRSLTPEEKEEVKQITRRIKNRESARRSRAEKKDKLSDLEQHVQLLNARIETLKLEMATLSTENKFLKNELEFTSSIIQSNPSLCQLFQQTKGQLTTPCDALASQRNTSARQCTPQPPAHADVCDSDVQECTDPFSFTPASPTPVTTQPVSMLSPLSPPCWTAPSLFLLILVFSFGLFAPASMASPGQCPLAGALDLYNHVTDSFSHVIPKPPRIFSTHDFQANGGTPSPPARPMHQFKFSPRTSSQPSSHSGAKVNVDNVHKLMSLHTQRLLSVG